MVLSDEKIKKNVIEQLHQYTSFEAGDLNVSVHEGRVTLTGTVPSYTALEKAVEAAMAVQGVSAVDNQLKVPYDTPMPSSE